jgi:hypothetical protein
MTEPDVASSDPTNLQTRAVRDGDEYVITGRKWFTSNAYHPNCRIAIAMVVTDPEAERHKRATMIKVIAANCFLDVLDRAIQVHGAMGVTNDTPWHVCGDMHVRCESSTAPMKYTKWSSPGVRHAALRPENLHWATRHRHTDSARTLARSHSHHTPQPTHSTV